VFNGSSACSILPVNTGLPSESSGSFYMNY
jgi:hypothetical protein